MAVAVAVSFAISFGILGRVASLRLREVRVRMDDCVSSSVDRIWWRRELSNLRAVRFFCLLMVAVMSALAVVIWFWLDLP